MQMLQNSVSAIYRRRYFFFLLLAFFAGCMVTGLFFGGQRFTGSGKLDSEYYSQYRRAAEIIGRLEEELGRERDINRRLREYNNSARELTEGLADSAERNVRNLQEAVSLIGEIRRKLKILAEFYADSDSGDGYY